MCTPAINFVYRSLFEKDKVLFALLLSTKVKIDAGALDSAHLRFLLTGGLAVGGPQHPNPAPGWISSKMWGEACRAEGLGPLWQGLAAHMTENVSTWKAVYDSPAPQDAALPEPWDSGLDAFQRLLLLRRARARLLPPPSAVPPADHLLATPVVLSVRLCELSKFQS
ncbi:Dynein heavy chain 3, axonemal [Monoraphidium neglectum]|uniref:Dynein heavy chain 3, axonemal n=1 Tax=Monoraphidium neglectum TaxID=145388 RepID=A0A0D2MFJ0_9CHLO|nr:Dynein heavy chain 3, axonemal [Monoraphidium neglectum]KIY99476.1 Dynein heavy chain 3, axonemal [Monoraphidium neglectum]|eukprot:XP_013898496.1 Dynein heavy chain 3, axonemal [Monoraphidium neglectum]